ncbi:MAG TPA: hypothetical protein DEW35_02320 [Ruminococcaceae bacterium]|nr:hypothetical protein [Oscillospiraceae bacterium]
MIKIILIVITIALAALGLTEFMYGLRACARAPECSDCATVLVLKDNEAEIQLEYAIFKSRWFGSRYSSCIIALTDRLSEETLKNCRALTEDTEVVLVPARYFENVINSLF